MVKVAIRLHDDQPGLIADWRTIDSAWLAVAVQFSIVSGVELPVDGMLDEWRALVLQSPIGRDVSFDRRVLTSLLNEWTLVGGVRQTLQWDHPMPDVTLWGDGLFGALAVQLQFAVSRTQGFAVCSVCGRPYVPTRRPRGDERRYCKRCVDDGARERAASRSWREKNRRSTGATGD
jgi:hypothetical protein